MGLIRNKNNRIFKSGMIVSLVTFIIVIVFIFIEPFISFLLSFFAGYVFSVAMFNSISKETETGTGFFRKLSFLVLSQLIYFLAYILYFADWAGVFSVFISSITGMLLLLILYRLYFNHDKPGKNLLAGIIINGILLMIPVFIMNLLEIENGLVLIAIVPSILAWQLAMAYLLNSMYSNNIAITDISEPEEALT